MTEPTRFAATAKPEDAQAPALSDLDRDIAAECERWVRWCYTRRLYGPKPLSSSVLGRLTGVSMRALSGDCPNAICSAQLAAFHVAYTCQPDALDKRVFDLYYVHRLKPVKAVAAALGIGRPHFYTLLRDFSRRVHAAAQELQPQTDRTA